MHSFSCFFLLHHHFDAYSSDTDILSTSSGSINDDIMTDEWDTDVKQTESDFTVVSPANEIIESESDNFPQQSTVNPIDEEREFIFDELSNTLFCVGTQYDDIPQSILDAYASKTKILDLSKNRFRSLDCLKNFPDLEELNLDENDLDDTHTVFPKLSNLKTLMLNKNRLQDIYKLVDQLRSSYPELEHLSLLGNEACPYRIIPTTSTPSTTNANIYAQNRVDEDYQRYRHLLIFRISTLKFLDASEISPNERNVAAQLGDILYTIAETKQSQMNNEERKVEKRENYTPLPTNTDANKYRVSLGTLKHKYDGKGSQGNKFVQDGDL